MNNVAAPQSVSMESRVGQIADEFTQRLNRGEHPDVEEYIQQYPDIADVLRQILPALLLLREPNVNLAAWQPVGDAETLGDFRLLREVGRGGMGIVYEAEQISLHRRVALKVLPFAAALDPRHLQRFRNEAQAAGQLHHSNIVAVYANGCERGVHYFAMQYIDGQSLADAIAQHSDGGRTNGEYFRWVARLGIEAAEALDHAHQQGVIHRDIKPGNLLLDGSGRLWVADFGLAHCLSGPGLTGTGDVVGTLRYMSPEQALAKRALVDHRSDIYSLGATLYEALTLQPAYPGRDREELLRQIADGEPRSPRSIEPAVPVDLETIVLKAMAREPERRFATAQEMADDLRRFLDGRPILAARPGWRERSVRWLLRHRAAVAAAVGMLLFAFAGLLVFTLLLLQAQDRTKDALGDAKEQKEEAQKQRQRTENYFDRALKGAARILIELDKTPDPRPLQGEHLREALVEKGLAFFQQFIDENNPDPTVRFHTARALGYMASVYCSQLKCDEGQAMLRKKYELLEKLVADWPENTPYRNEMFLTRYLMGMMYKSLRKPDQARSEYVRTAELGQQIIPHDRDGELWNSYAWFLVDCPDKSFWDPAKAVDLAEGAVARQPQNGRFWNTLAVARYRAGKWQAAIPALKKSSELRTPDKGGDPWDWLFLAMSYWQLGEREQAREWFKKSIRWMDENPPPKEDLLRYRQEAEELFGK